MPPPSQRAKPLVSGGRAAAGLPPAIPSAGPTIARRGMTRCASIAAFATSEVRSADAMASLELNLLGGFDARFGTGEALVPLGRKAQLLLAFLALRAGEPQTREKLIGVLWSDRGDAQARGSLRQEL